MCRIATKAHALSCVESTPKEKEPNIDFGSADPTYCDLNEMEPDFNDVPTDIDLE